jgi:hypothetical protein
VALFPAQGDFTVSIGMRYDKITPWGTFLGVLDTPSTEPIGSNELGDDSKALLIVAGDAGTGWELYSALDGSIGPIAFVPLGFQLRDFELECVGTSFTVRVDGEVVYGPVTGTLRPTAIFMGNPVLAYWYPTNWCWFTMDYIRVKVPGPVPVRTPSWGAVKARYRGGERWNAAPCATSRRADVETKEGAMVRQVLGDGRTEAGEHAVMWSGRDGQGARTASGVYFVQLTDGRTTESRKVVLLR